MKCERFVFEASYQAEYGEAALSQAAQAHLRQCAACLHQYQRLNDEIRFVETESAALVTHRLHRAVQVAVAKEAAKSAMIPSFVMIGVQVALSLVVLVGSISAIVFQNHPNTAPTVNARLVYARR